MDIPIDILEDLLGLELGNQDERLHNLCENNRYKTSILQHLHKTNNRLVLPKYITNTIHHIQVLFQR